MNNYNMTESSQRTNSLNNTKVLYGKIKDTAVEDCSGEMPDTAQDASLTSKLPGPVLKKVDLHRSRPRDRSNAAVWRAKAAPSTLDAHPKMCSPVSMPDACPPVVLGRTLESALALNEPFGLFVEAPRKNTPECDKSGVVEDHQPSCSLAAAVVSRLAVEGQRKSQTPKTLELQRAPRQTVPAAAKGPLCAGQTTQPLRLKLAPSREVVPVDGKAPLCVGPTGGSFDAVNPPTGSDRPEPAPAAEKTKEGKVVDYVGEGVGEGSGKKPVDPSAGGGKGSGDEPKPPPDLCPYIDDIPEEFQRVVSRDRIPDQYLRQLVFRPPGWMRVMFTLLCVTITIVVALRYPAALLIFPPALIPILLFAPVIEKFPVFEQNTYEYIDVETMTIDTRHPVISHIEKTTNLECVDWRFRRTTMFTDVLGRDLSVRLSGGWWARLLGLPTVSMYRYREEEVRVAPALLASAIQPYYTEDSRRFDLESSITSITRISAVNVRDNPFMGTVTIRSNTAIFAAAVVKSSRLAHTRLFGVSGPGTLVLYPREPTLAEASPVLEEAFSRVPGFRVSPARM